MLAPRAVGVAKKTSSTLYGWPSISISIFFFNSFAPINAILIHILIGLAEAVADPDPEDSADEAPKKS